MIKQHTIRSRVVRVVLLGILITSVLITLLFSWREVRQFNDDRIEQVRAVAAVFAAAVAEPLVQRDRFRALRALRAISRIPGFKKALVIDLEKSSFAELGSAVVLNRTPFLPVLFKRNLAVTVPVIKSGRPVGELSIVVDTSQLLDRLRDNLLIGLLVALLAALLGAFIGVRQQERITGPINQLTKKMREIRDTQDFDQQVPHVADDETGVMVDAFNDMMANIRERDQRLEKHLQDLESEVAQRTVSYKKAKDDADHANAAKSSFLATMSHEIRTPMNGILVMAELLARTELPPQHQRYADVIVRSGESLLAIINDILDFSKIESGKLELEKTTLNPSETINHVVSLFWEKANSSGLDIAAYIAPDVPEEIEGDPVRINQIVSNLVNNALKFTESGHVEIRVEGLANADREDGITLEFSVTDTGIGIPEEKCQSVFEAFSQADQSTTRKFGGTGLGLAICKRLAGAMGGEIGVRSELGNGSTFFFTMPTRNMSAGRDIGSREPLSTMKRVAVCVDGDATSDTLVSYLEDRSVKVRRISHRQLANADLTEVDLVLAEPVFIRELDIQPSLAGSGNRPYFVCLEYPGQAEGTKVIEDGLADDLIMCPVERRDFFELLERLDEGRPLGRRLLEKSARKSAELPRFKDLRVLVADDSPVNLEVAREALKQLAVKPDLVEDGAAAVEAVRETDYDIILMDCSMPVMSGYEATRQIRLDEAQSGGKAVPIIALTAHVAGGPANEWRDAGMNRYITKPFNLVEIADCLSELCPHKLGSDDDPSIEQTDCEPGDGQDKSVAGQKPVPAVSSTDENGRAVVNPETLQKLAGLSPDSGNAIVLRILGMFEQHGVDSFGKLQETMSGEDVQEIASAAHALKSMTSNIGAERLFDACAALEKTAANDCLPDTGPLFDKISGELDLVLVEIKSLKAAA